MATTLIECLEFIQGKSMDEFIQSYPHPVLIGLGIIAGELLSNPVKVAGTMFLNLNTIPTGGDHSSLVNQVFFLQKNSKSAFPVAGILIGSGAENDVVIADSSISKQHLQIIIKNDESLIVDIGSTNGSFVNGLRTEPHVPMTLTGGDIVTLGRFSFTFYDSVSFAKLLIVQSMAKSRVRSPQKTPGNSSKSATPFSTTNPKITVPSGARPQFNTSQVDQKNTTKTPWSSASAHSNSLAHGVTAGTNQRQNTSQTPLSSHNNFGLNQPNSNNRGGYQQQANIGNSQNVQINTSNAQTNKQTLDSSLGNNSLKNSVGASQVSSVMTNPSIASIWEEEAPTQMYDPSITAEWQKRSLGRNNPQTLSKSSNPINTALNQNILKTSQNQIAVDNGQFASPSGKNDSSENIVTQLNQSNYNENEVRQSDFNKLNNDDESSLNNEEIDPFLMIQIDSDSSSIEQDNSKNLETYTANPFSHIEKTKRTTWFSRLMIAISNIFRKLGGE